MNTSSNLRTSTEKRSRKPLVIIDPMSHKPTEPFTSPVSDDHSQTLSQDALIEAKIEQFRRQFARTLTDTGDK